MRYTNRLSVYKSWGRGEGVLELELETLILLDKILTIEIALGSLKFKIFYLMINSAFSIRDELRTIIYINEDGEYCKSNKTIIKGTCNILFKQSNKVGDLPNLPFNFHTIICYFAWL